ncbi:MAG: class I SAM-dependent methyltransferase [Anaerolineales bacterium]|nr:class I SAM-dependent methyltransferase [Anaerolineales bacterium]
MKHEEGDTDWIRSFYTAAVEWWGESWYDGENLKGRLDIVKKYASETDKRILELAAGTGEIAICFCDHGYSVLAVDLCHKNIELMTKIQKERPNLRVMEGDFLKIHINEQFPTICMFEAFGFGSDQEQQQLLEKVEKWLTPNGILILDVYHPWGPIQASGTKRELDKLEDIPGSVDMTEYSYYDPIKSRWIDIWEPKNDKDNRKTQSIRCYTPADFVLLAKTCGLSVEKMLCSGKEFDHESTEIASENIFNNDDRNYAYTVIMRKKV